MGQRGDGGHGERVRAAPNADTEGVAVANAIEQRLTTLVQQQMFPRMASKTRNISLPPELDRSIQERVRSGLYGNASDVVRAGLRALAREEMAASYQHFTEIMATLPQDPITPEIEQEVVKAVRRSRAAEKQEASK